MGAGADDKTQIDAVDRLVLLVYYYIGSKIKYGVKMNNNLFSGLTFSGSSSKREISINKQTDSLLFSCDNGQTIFSEESEIEICPNCQYSIDTVETPYKCPNCEKVKLSF
ncbi:hypothetical protein KJ991_01160 [Patescibacteria group bacterium]|nr:hypothetical protein [Patescibacteria group bacterium]MBU4115913.1 hypothetical protein [Patescibacteria group bacterium]